MKKPAIYIVPLLILILGTLVYDIITDKERSTAEAQCVPVPTHTLYSCPVLEGWPNNISATLNTCTGGVRTSPTCTWVGMDGEDFRYVSQTLNCTPI